MRDSKLRHVKQNNRDHFGSGFVSAVNTILRNLKLFTLYAHMGNFSVVRINKSYNNMRRIIVYDMGHI